MPNEGKTEAQKFFDSLPEENQQEEGFSFFEKKKEEQQQPEKVETPVEPTPEKEEDEQYSEKRPNRRERRSEQMRFYEQMIAEERAVRERLETMLLERTQEKSTQEEDARLTRLFGDTPQGKEASRIVQELLSETKEQAIAPYRELEQQRQAETELEARFDQEIEDGLANVEDEFGVDLTSRSARQLRSDFLDFVDELSPEDSFVNFEKAWQVFQANQSAKPSSEEIDRKKQIASRGVQRSSPARPDPSKAEPMSFDKWDSIKSKIFG